MLVVPYEKINQEQANKRNKLLIDTFGSVTEDLKELSENEIIKELILLYQKGIILEPLDVASHLIYFDFLKFYKLMLLLTKENKHNRAVFISSWGTLEDKKSNINRLLL